MIRANDPANCLDDADASATCGHARTSSPQRRRRRMLLPGSTATHRRDDAQQQSSRPTEPSQPAHRANCFANCSNDAGVLVARDVERARASCPCTPRACARRSHGCTTPSTRPHHLLPLGTLGLHRSDRTKVPAPLCRSPGPGVVCLVAATNRWLRLLGERGLRSKLLQCNRKTRSGRYPALPLEGAQRRRRNEGEDE